MNVLQQIKLYFRTYMSESDFRRKIATMSFSVTEEDIVEGYKYIETL